MLRFAMAGSIQVISVTSTKTAICLWWAARKTWSKAGGISIYPLEIEGVLYKHPDVVEAAVIGVPDPQWGEALKAVVVLQKDSRIDGMELIQFCKTQLASYKVPKSVDIVSSLPHTEIGKVNKVKLKESILAAAAL